MAKQEDVFKKIVSHAKEYGFVFPSSEIYNGLGAVYDYGQNGVEMKNNIKRYWWEAIDPAPRKHCGYRLGYLTMHPTIWKGAKRTRWRFQRPFDRQPRLEKTLPR